MRRTVALAVAIGMLALGYLLFWEWPSQSDIDGAEPNAAGTAADVAQSAGANELQSLSERTPARMEQAGQEADALEPDAAEFASGAVVRLVGYPDGIEPRVAKHNSIPVPTPPTPIAGVAQTDGSWRFDDLPLGDEWDVVFFRSSADGRPATADGLLAKRFAGPHDRQPVVEVVCKLQDGPGITGILVDAATGQPIPQGSRIDNDYRVSAFSAVGPHKSAMYWIELFDDGRFVAQPSQHAAQSHRLAEMHSVQFVDLLTNEAASIEVDVRADQNWADLGEVAIGSAQPLFTIKVVNGQGRPRQRATLYIDAKVKHAGQEDSWESLHLGSKMLTNGDGVLHGYGPSLEELVNFGRSARSVEGQEGVDSLRIRAGALGYCDTTREFPAGQKLMQLQLPKAGNLRWRMRRGELSALSLRVTAVPLDAYTDGDLSYRRIPVRPSDLNDEGGWLTGVLENVPQQPFDLVVEFAGRRSSTWPYLRLKNVIALPANQAEVVAPVSLDLMANVEAYSCEIVDAQGQVFDEERLLAEKPYVTCKVVRNGKPTSSTCRGLVKDGRIYFYLPRQAQPISGSIRLQQQGTIAFEDWSSGHHQLSANDD